MGQFKKGLKFLFPNLFIAHEHLDRSYTYVYLFVLQQMKSTILSRVKQGSKRLVVFNFLSISSLIKCLVSSLNLLMFVLQPKEASVRVDLTFSSKNSFKITQE